MVKTRVLDNHKELLFQVNRKKKKTNAGLWVGKRQFVNKN